MKRWLLAIIVCLCLTSFSCSHLTVAPAPVQTHQVSSWAKENVLAADTKGVLVTAEFVRVYHELLKEYGSKLQIAERPATPDDGITAEGNNFRISYVVQSRFAELKTIDRGRP